MSKLWFLLVESRDISLKYEVFQFMGVVKNII